MDVDPDAMSQAVTHLPRKPVLGKHMLSELVRLLARHPRAKHSFYLLICIANGRIARAKLLRRLADEHGARHVGAIPLRPRAKIHHDALPRLELRSSRDGMGTCAIRAARHDRGECKPLGAMAYHEVLQLDLYLALGHARLHEGDDMGKRRVSDGLRRLHAGDLVRILHTAKAHDEVRGLTQLHIGQRLDECLFERAKARKRH